MTLLYLSEVKEMLGGTVKKKESDDDYNPKVTGNSMRMERRGNRQTIAN